MATKSSLERVVLTTLITLTALSVLACYYRFLILEDLEAFYDDYSEEEIGSEEELPIEDDDTLLDESSPIEDDFIETETVSE